MIDELLEVKLSDITWPDETDITKEQIRNMAKSLEENEQIEPIVVTKFDALGWQKAVRPTDKVPAYRGVVGRLRYEGTKTRWKDDLTKTILARIHSFESEADLVKWQLAENEHRRQIPAMTKAKLYQKLAGLLEAKTEGKEKLTLQMLSTAIEEATGDKESTKTVQHYLSLNKLAPETQELLTREKAPLRTGLELLRLKSGAAQVKVLEEIQKYGVGKDSQFRYQDVKWRVEAALGGESHERQLERLKKKADELRKVGKIVFTEEDYDYGKHHRFYDWERNRNPEKCKECPKRGIFLTGNFKQEQMCPDKKCFEAEERKRLGKEDRADKDRDKKAEAELTRLTEMPMDDRTWRLVLWGIVDNYSLSQSLGIGWHNLDKAWKKIQEMDAPTIQKMLVKMAAEKILQGSDDEVKMWAIEQFGLQKNLFVKEATLAKEANKI